MATVNHDHQPNDEVYIVTTCGDRDEPTVISGRIIRVVISVLSTKTTVTYMATSRVSSSTEFDEADVFANKADAIAAFGLRVS